jgi:hypothetical protein
MTRLFGLMVMCSLSGTAQAACGWGGSASDFFRCLMDTSVVVDGNAAHLSELDGRVDAVETATWDLSAMMLTAGDVLSTVAGEGYALLVDIAPVGLTGSFLDLTDVPASLEDGDDDALGRLVCVVGDVPVFDGDGWVCGSVPGAGDDLTMIERLEALEEMVEDSDGDGWVDLVDNCPDLASSDLMDTDGDGVGDLCDECAGGADTMDTDGDGVADACDRCPEEDDMVDDDADGFPDCLGDGTDFGGWTWMEGPRGESCEGVCETEGLSCVDLAGTGWVETADSNICSMFYPALSTRSDGDGPRLSETNVDGSPSASSQCVYHDHEWDGATCAWVERDDDVRFCPCE